jgi:1-acyl-sn-glycerol-3-phosphate acyltransferase
MIFPEGTRSPDGSLRAFKDGAFELAVRHRVPILPIVIRGTSNALPKKGFVLGMKCVIDVQVLSPLDPASFEGESAGEVRNRVHDLFIASLKQGSEERRSQ